MSDNDTQKEITLEEALEVVQRHAAPKPKTYEEGLAEGEQRGREAVLGTANKLLAETQAQIGRFAEAHSSDSPAGRALNQIGSDVQNRLASLKDLVPKVDS